MKTDYTIIFTYCRETEKAIFVYKESNKKNFWIPKSIIISSKRYDTYRSMGSEVDSDNVRRSFGYTIEKIKITLPTWFVDKALGFRR